MTKKEQVEYLLFCADTWSASTYNDLVKMNKLQFALQVALRYIDDDDVLAEIENNLLHDAMMSCASIKKGEGN